MSMVKATHPQDWEMPEEQQRLRWLLVDADAWLLVTWPLREAHPSVCFCLDETKVLLDIRRKADETLYRGFHAWIRRVAREVAKASGSLKGELPRAWLPYYQSVLNDELAAWRDKFLPHWLGRPPDTKGRRLTDEEATWVIAQFRDAFKRQEHLTLAEITVEEGGACDGK